MIHSLRFVERQVDNGDGTVSTVKVLQQGEKCNVYEESKGVNNTITFGKIIGEDIFWKDVPLIKE